MNNNQAIAYAVVALEQLQKEKKLINDEFLSHRMLSLMGQYNEKEIYEKYISE